jgi:Protein of unknown function (DUF3606)
MANTRSRPRRVAKATVVAPAPRSAPAYVVPGLGDEDYAVAHRYGVLVADRHGRKEFAEVEPILSEQWVTARGTSRLPWEQARPAVQEGYAGVVRVQPVKEADRPAKARTGRGKPRAAKRGATSARGKATRTAARGRSRGDDLTKRGPQDRSRISVTEPWEVKYWCERLGVTPAQLKRAVKSAGPSVKNVRRQLGK